MNRDDFPSGEAEVLLSSPLLNELFDELEQQAIEGAIYAKALDDDKRRAFMDQVRAIRAIREKLKILARKAKGEETTAPRDLLA